MQRSKKLPCPFLAPSRRLCLTTVLSCTPKKAREEGGCGTSTYVSTITILVYQLARPAGLDNWPDLMIQLFTTGDIMNRDRPRFFD